MQTKPIVGVYRITNSITGDCYIGSSNNIDRRWRQHRQRLARSSHDNLFLARAWFKYGADAFQFSTLAECDRDDLTKIEQRYLDSEKPEYNIAKIAGQGPGMVGRKHSEATLEKLRAVEFSEERRAKLRAAHARRWTPEARERQRQSHLGHIPTPETIEKLRQSLIGRPVSEETRRKIGAANSGRPSASKGISLSKETKEKIGLANRGRVVSVETRAKMSAAQQARGPRGPLSEETRRKIGLVHLGKRLTDEQRAHISKVQTGRKLPPEWRTNIGRALKGNANARRNKQQDLPMQLKLL